MGGYHRTPSYTILPSLAEKGSVVKTISSGQINDRNTGKGQFQLLLETGGWERKTNYLSSINDSLEA